MINLNYFSVSKKEPEPEKGRFDMLDSVGSDDNIEIDIEGGQENSNLLDKTKGQVKEVTDKVGKKLESAKESV